MICGLKKEIETCDCYLQYLFGHILTRLIGHYQHIYILQLSWKSMKDNLVQLRFGCIKNPSSGLQIGLNVVLIDCWLHLYIFIKISNQSW